MSNEEERLSNHPELTSGVSDDQMYSAQYKDGQLQIVEVAPYDKVSEARNEIEYEDSILPDQGSSDGETKYLHLDLLNFAIVKNADGTNTYQMVSSDVASDNSDTTITCVLSNDVDDGENQESYVMLQADEHDPYMYLQTVQDPEHTAESELESQPEPAQSKDNPKRLTPVQILEKAKALQKAKALLNYSSVPQSKRGRKRKSALPPPMELLSSPNFKLYLYSCKLCTFKCNAVKEMSIHKKTEHSGGSKGGGSKSVGLQCPHCPFFKAHTHRQLMNHVSLTHNKESQTTGSNCITALQLDSEEVEAADVLVCGACGFESGDRALFKTHIVVVHGSVTSIK